MAWSQVYIANLALNRIGAKSFIAAIDEKTVAGQRVAGVWDAVFQEVLSERDWKFAKTRTALEQSTLTPLYGYSFAYSMPDDFLRFVRPRRKQPNPYDYYWGAGPEGTGWYLLVDPPLWPPYYPYVIETMKDAENNYKKYVLTDYDSTDSTDVMITYIRLISDYSQLMPGFVNCFANRLAAEVAIPLTEDAKKFEAMTQMYRDSLNSAEAQNECYDYFENESGSRAWITAGRW